MVADVVDVMIASVVVGVVQVVGVVVVVGVVKVLGVVMIPFVVVRPAGSVGPLSQVLHRTGQTADKGMPFGPSTMTQ